MNYNELSGSTLYAGVRKWLDNNPGKTLADFTKETKYTGPELQIKDPKTGRIGLRKRSTDAQRAARIAAQDQEYLNTLINEYGYTEKDAKIKLKATKSKVQNLRNQVTELNKEFGKGSFTVGHLTAVKEGGGDFGRNVKLEIGKSTDGKRGNFSRAAVDELPQNIKAVLGIPSNGREAAIMDESGMFDLPLTPKDRQNIIRNPEAANEIITNRLKFVENQSSLIKSGGTVKFAPNRAQMTALAGAGIAALGPLGTAASAAETAGRTQIAQETGNPLDYVQAGIAGVSTAADVASYAPPVAPVASAVSTAADVTNVAIDTARSIDIGNELKYIGGQVRLGKLPYGLEQAASWIKSAF